MPATATTTADGDGYDSDGYGGTDCYDESADAYPGQTDFFMVDPRADGSFDYDCDGSDSLEYAHLDRLLHLCSRRPQRHPDLFGLGSARPPRAAGPDSGQAPTRTACSRTSGSGSVYYLCREIGAGPTTYMGCN